MSEQLHPMAPHHLPFYLAPGSGTDVLMVVMGIFLIGTILWVGTLYWKLHSLPERMAHKSQKLQFERLPCSVDCFRVAAIARSEPYVVLERQRHPIALV